MSEMLKGVVVKTKRELPSVDIIAVIIISAVDKLVTIHGKSCVWKTIWNSVRITSGLNISVHTTGTKMYTLRITPIFWRNTGAYIEASIFYSSSEKCWFLSNGFVDFGTLPVSNLTKISRFRIHSYTNSINTYNFELLPLFSSFDLMSEIFVPSLTFLDH